MLEPEVKARVGFVEFKQNGEALQFASERLNNDKDVVLEAIKQNGDAFRFASARFKDDKDVVLEAVKRGPVKQRN